MLSDLTFNFIVTIAARAFAGLQALGILYVQYRITSERIRNHCYATNPGTSQTTPSLKFIQQHLRVLQDYMYCKHNLLIYLKSNSAEPIRWLSNNPALTIPSDLFNETTSLSSLYDLFLLKIVIKSYLFSQLVRIFCLFLSSINICTFILFTNALRCGGTCDGLISFQLNHQI